jgi:hypothetical protein
MTRRWQTREVTSTSEDQRQYLESVLSTIRVEDRVSVDSEIAKRIDTDEHMADVGLHCQLYLEIR